MSPHSPPSPQIDPALKPPVPFTTQAAYSGYFTPRGFQDTAHEMTVAPAMGDFNAYLEKNWPVSKQNGQGEHSRLLELIKQKAQLDERSAPTPGGVGQPPWPMVDRPPGGLFNTAFGRDPPPPRNQLDPDSGIELYNFIAASSSISPRDIPPSPYQWPEQRAKPPTMDYGMMDGEYQFSPATGSFRPQQQRFYQPEQPELPPPLKIRIVNGGEAPRDPTPPADTQPFIHHRPPPELIPTMQPPMPGGWAFDFVNWPPPPASKDEPSSSTGVSFGLLPAAPGPEPVAPRRGSKMSMTLSVGRSSATPSSRRDSELTLGSRRKSSEIDHSPYAKRRSLPDGRRQSLTAGDLPLGQRKAGARSSGLPPNGDEERKVVIACFNCRSKKLRCDGARPACSGCVRKGIESECNYDVAVRRRGPGRKTLEKRSDSRKRRSSSSDDDYSEQDRRVSMNHRDSGWGEGNRRLESALREID